MRDGGFEIGIKDLSVKLQGKKKAEKYYSWHRIINGQMTSMTCSNKKTKDHT